MIYDFMRFFHILAVVFMSAPLYNLVVVHERKRLIKPTLAVERYFENIIRGSALRCYVYQLTALITGILLIPLRGSSLSDLIMNPILLAKLILLLVLTTLLSIVYYRLQPVVDRLLSEAEGEAMSESITRQIAPIRLRRTRLAAFCLFIVITIVLLGLQITAQFGFWTTALLIVLAALFSWRVYRTPIRFGWI
ncbi:MAG: hypothetical protein A3J94_09815 [Syntrophus sp. RIFOXYC2_FULL_54_9]|nr:MAG: hypothetical protein A3J94_09815 [Syntrophus sp. RIFOXYC2_FULL_54_9]HBB16272.1 hypothetical protein [Syntrophus sp. (in: bacteria)]